MWLLDIYESANASALPSVDLQTSIPPYLHEPQRGEDVEVPIFAHFSCTVFYLEISRRNAISARLFCFFT